MPWYDTYDDTFFLTLAGLIFGFLGLSIRFCYRSKCSSVECCGLKIIRDVDVEEDIDLQNGGDEEEKV